MIKQKIKWFSCSYCGEDFKSLNKKRYCDNCILRQLQQPLHKSSTTRSMIRNREFIRNYKKNKGCEICGYNKHPEILDFHHKNRNDKNKGVNILMKTLKNIETIKKEIEKCILVCPNCHRELHLMERYGKNGVR